MFEEWTLLKKLIWLKASALSGGGGGGGIKVRFRNGVLSFTGFTSSPGWTVTTGS